MRFQNRIKHTVCHSKISVEIARCVEPIYIIRRDCAEKPDPSLELEVGNFLFHSPAAATIANENEQDV